jgi:hypothetical protein
MNLGSAQYEKEKGWCEDSDEGKLSLQLIHAYRNSNADNLLLETILMQRRVS